MYVYIYIYIHTHTHARTHICIHTYTYIHIYTHVLTRKLIWRERGEQNTHASLLKVNALTQAFVFLLSAVVWRNQMVYVYDPAGDTGGEVCVCACVYASQPSLKCHTDKLSSEAGLAHRMHIPMCAVMTTCS